MNGAHHTKGPLGRALLPVVVAAFDSLPLLILIVG